MASDIDSSCIIDIEKLEYFKHYREILIIEKINIIQAWILDQPKDKELEECYTEFNKALFNENLGVDYWSGTFNNVGRDSFREIVYKFEYKMFGEIGYEYDIEKIDVKYDNQDPKKLMRQTLLKQIEVNNNKIESEISDDDLKGIIESNNELFKEIYNLNNKRNRNEF